MRGTVGRGRLFEALLFLGALALRGVAVWYERLSPFHALGPMDSEEYLKMAQAFSTGTWPDADPYFWAPGYALFLIPLRHFSTDLETIKIAQGGAAGIRATQPPATRSGCDFARLDAAGSRGFDTPFQRHDSECHVARRQRPEGRRRGARRLCLRSRGHEQPRGKDRSEGKGNDGS